jgi:tRNA threonylcarbamoyladenosine biosynthesis protein TsaB
MEEAIGGRASIAQGGPRSLSLAVRILALDSTTPLCSVALLDAAEIVGEVRVRSKDGHSPHLLPAVEFLLTRHAIAPLDLDAIAVTVGPGSFTGLRVGMSTAQGLALAAARPCFGVSALEATAFGALGKAPTVVALLDAFRGETFAASYDTAGRPLGGPTVGPVDRVLAGLGAEPVAFVGHGAEKWREAILGHVREPLFPTWEPALAAAVARIALVRFTAGERPAAGDLRPLYLRGVDIGAPAR